MDRPIDVLKNVAPVIGDTREFQEIAKVLNPELENLWSSIGKVLSEWFLSSMSEYGIARIEKMLGIMPYDTDTIEDRRFRLKARYNQETPYTYRSLYNMIDNLCNGDFEMSLDGFVLKVKLGLGVRKQFAEVQNLLERIVPANIIIVVDILYNTNDTLSKFTHAQLAKYTHYQLHDEVLTSTRKEL